MDRSRFYENKRAVTNKELGPLIKTIMTRCINCTRCVRFADEVAGTSVLGQMNRGEDAEIGTFIDQLVKTELSGNMIDICPVGALTSKPYAFKARSWELRKTESIDVHDALGCNIRVDARGGEVQRILPRLHEDINEEWIDDRARFSYDGLGKARLDRPYIKDQDSGKLKESSWEEAFAYIAEKLEGLKGKEMAALAGNMADVESMVALRDLMNKLGAPNMDCRTDGSQIDPSVRAGYIFNSGIKGAEEADAILMIGTNPRSEAAILNSRIRKNWRQNGTKVALIGQECDLAYPYEHLGDSPKDLEKLLKAKTGFAKILKSAEKPMVIVGSSVFAREDGEALHDMLCEAADKLGLIKDGWNGFNVLQRAASRVGALDVGFVPQAGGKGFADILKGTKDGSIKALYLLGADEFDARSAIGWQCFVIYQGHHGDHGALRADVILPGAAYTEKDALYVNTEGRPQMAKRAVFPPGEAKEDWKILRALSEKLGETLPYNTHGQLRARIFEDWKSLAKIDFCRKARWGKFGEKGTINKSEPFGLLDRNFYLADAICRASETMQACSREFTGQGVEVKEAAE